VKKKKVNRGYPLYGGSTTGGNRKKIRKKMVNTNQQKSNASKNPFFTKKGLAKKLLGKEKMAATKKSLWKGRTLRKYTILWGKKPFKRGGDFGGCAMGK